MPKPMNPTHIHAGGSRHSLPGAFRHRRVAVTIALSMILAAALGVSAEARELGLAARLAARDPGARTGADTIVATGARNQIFGVPDRSNYIIALGSDETIRGGGRDDELGALGSNVTIRAGTGKDLLIGGAGGTLIGGKGRDLLIDHKDNAIVRVNSSANEVIVSGHHDRVLCAPGLRNDTIYAGASDTVSQACRADHATVLPVTRLPQTPPSPRATAAATVRGDGSNAHPFQSQCEDPTQQPCTVTFPARTLTGLWANEHVPAYQCPTAPDDDRHENLDSQRTYVPFGTAVPRGVEIQGLGPIGVSISGIRYSGYHPGQGTLTGYTYSSATNWTIGSASYRVILHCAERHD